MLDGRQRHVGDGNEPSRKDISIADKAKPISGASFHSVEYRCLFLQGAIGENAIVPMISSTARLRRLREHRECRRSPQRGWKYTRVNIAASSEDRKFTCVPPRHVNSWTRTPPTSRLHDETIGVVNTIGS